METALPPVFGKEMEIRNELADILKHGYRLFCLGFLIEEKIVRVLDRNRVTNEGFFQSSYAR